MKYTKFSFNGKKLALLSIGCMRYRGRSEAAEIIPYMAKHGALFLDTSPMYCFRSESENNETWVGSAIKNIKDKVILSAKCSTGGGGTEVGEYNPVHGFSITTADQVRRVIDQSLRRLDVDRFDMYQLWSIHSPRTFEEAFKKGGWLEGVMKAKEEGLFGHLGITGHSGADDIKRWVDTGLFESVTVPFNLMDNSRLEGLLYAMEKNVATIAMNPLAGGLLGGPSGELAEKMSDMGIKSAADLAIRYINAYGISALAGVSVLGEAEDDIAIMEHDLLTPGKAETLRARFFGMIDESEFSCTSCGYCMPCPAGLKIPDIFRLRNHAKVLGLASAKQELEWKAKNDDAFNAKKCTTCGKCEKKCPNGLRITDMMAGILEG